MIMCSIDELTVKGVRGWAIDEARPDRPVILHVMVDGEPLFEIVCSQVREDVAAAGFKSERVGYDFPLPEHIIDGRPHRLELRCRLGEMTVLHQGSFVEEVEFSLEHPLRMHSYVDGLTHGVLRGWVVAARGEGRLTGQPRPAGDLQRRGGRPDHRQPLPGRRRQGVVGRSELRLSVQAADARAFPLPEALPLLPAAGARRARQLTVRDELRDRPARSDRARRDRPDRPDACRPDASAPAGQGAAARSRLHAGGLRRLAARAPDGPAPPGGRAARGRTRAGGGADRRTTGQHRHAGLPAAPGGVPGRGRLDRRPDQSGLGAGDGRRLQRRCGAGAPDGGVRRRRPAHPGRLPRRQWRHQPGDEHRHRAGARRLDHVRRP